MTIKNKNAFTIVEAIVVVLISTAVFAGIYAAFLVGNKTWVYYNDSVAVKKEARNALMRMTAELREAENVRVIESPDGSAIYFFRPSVGNVSYVWNKQGDDAARIIRLFRGEEKILASQISALSFQYTGNAILIDITASKETKNAIIAQIVIREKIALRSKTTLLTR